MTMQPRELAEKIAAVADDKKGKDILILNMEGISYMTDYFVIASASNTTLVRAIADAIEDKLAEDEVLCRHKEGYNGGRWILMDFGAASGVEDIRNFIEIYCICIRCRSTTSVWKRWSVDFLQSMIPGR